LLFLRGAAKVVPGAEADRGRGSAVAGDEKVRVERAFPQQEAAIENERVIENVPTLNQVE
jgi:hypothetical protein